MNTGCIARMLALEMSLAGLVALEPPIQGGTLLQRWLCFLTVLRAERSVAEFESRRETPLPLIQQVQPPQPVPPQPQPPPQPTPPQPMPPPQPKPPPQPMPPPQPIPPPQPTPPQPMPPPKPSLPTNAPPSPGYPAFLRCGWSAYEFLPTKTYGYEYETRFAWKEGGHPGCQWL